MKVCVELDYRRPQAAILAEMLTSGRGITHVELTEADAEQLTYCFGRVVKFGEPWATLLGFHVEWDDTPGARMWAYDEAREMVEDAGCVVTQLWHDYVPAHIDPDFGEIPAQYVVSGRGILPENDEHPHSRSRAGVAVQGEGLDDLTLDGADEEGLT